MARMRLVLASMSPARLRVLRSAGLDPEVAVSGVHEWVPDGMDAAAAVALLAERKAVAVVARFPDALVLGCDSVVDLDGRLLGKPSSPVEATEWWRAMRGRTVTVWTGHCLIDGRTGASESWTAEADVRFAQPSDDEITAYVATGEPHGAAGAFRLDGLAAAFIESIAGDPGTVHGVSVPALRLLLAELGVEITDLWA